MMDSVLCANAALEWLRWRAVLIVAAWSLVLGIGSATSVAAATKPVAPAATKPVYLEGHASLVGAVAFTPDGKSLLTGSWDGTIRRWDLKAGAQVGRIQSPGGYVLSLAVLSDGKRFVSGMFEDNSVRLWDAGSGKQLKRFDGLVRSPPLVRLSGDGKLLAVGMYRAVVLIDPATLTEVRRLETERKVTQVSLSGDGKKVAGVLSSDRLDPGGAAVWDTRSGQLVRTFPGRREDNGYVEPVWDVDLSPDGRTLLIGSQKGLRAYDVGSGDLLYEFDKYREPGAFSGPVGVACLRFSADGALALAAGGRNTLRVWRTRDWSVVGKFSDAGSVLDAMFRPNYFVQAAFSRDGKRVAAGCTDGKVRVWEVPSER